MAGRDSPGARDYFRPMPAQGMLDFMKALHKLGLSVADIDKMAKSEGWKKALETKGWADTYLAGADFDAQLAKDVDTTTAILKDVGLVK